MSQTYLDDVRTTEHGAIHLLWLTPAAKPALTGTGSGAFKPKSSAMTEERTPEREIINATPDQAGSFAGRWASEGRPQWSKHDTYAALGECGVSV